MDIPSEMKLERSVRTKAPPEPSRWLRGPAVVLIALVLSACSSNNEWEEDVQLAGGQVITVHRKTRILRVLLSDGGGSVQKQWFSYKPLGVAWQTENQLEQPLSFDVLGGVAYLVTQNGRFCVQSDGYLQGLRVVRWNGKEATEIAPASAPLDKMTFNLHRYYKGRDADDDTRGHQTLILKREGWRAVRRNTNSSFDADPAQGMPLMRWEAIGSGLERC